MIKCNINNVSQVSKCSECEQENKVRCPHYKRIKIMKKEEIIEQLANLKHDNENFLLKDQLCRKEFAKAFDWYKEKRQFDYYGDRELRLPTWEEVFVKLGKILAARNFMDFEGNISELECKLEDLERKIRDEIKKD